MTVWKLSGSVRALDVPGAMCLLLGGRDGGCAGWRLDLVGVQRLGGRDPNRRRRDHNRIRRIRGAGG